MSENNHIPTNIIDRSILPPPDQASQKTLKFGLTAKDIENTWDYLNNLTTNAAKRQQFLTSLSGEVSTACNYDLQEKPDTPALDLLVSWLRVDVGYETQQTLIEKSRNKAEDYQRSLISNVEMAGTLLTDAGIMLADSSHLTEAIWVLNLFSGNKHFSIESDRQRLMIKIVNGYRTKKSTPDQSAAVSLVNSVTTSLRPREDAIRAIINHDAPFTLQLQLDTIAALARVCNIQEGNYQRFSFKEYSELFFDIASRNLPVQNDIYTNVVDLLTQVANTEHEHGYSGYFSIPDSRVKDFANAILEQREPNAKHIPFETLLAQFKLKKNLDGRIVSVAQRQ